MIDGWAAPIAEGPRLQVRVLFALHQTVTNS